MRINAINTVHVMHGFFIFAIVSDTSPETTRVRLKEYQKYIYFFLINKPNMSVTEQTISGTKIFFDSLLVSVIDELYRRIKHVYILYPYQSFSVSI